MSNVLGVSRVPLQIYSPSREDGRLCSVLKKIHVDNHRAYECRRLTDALKDQGESIGRTRVTMLMKEHRIVVKIKSHFG